MVKALLTLELGLFLLAFPARIQAQAPPPSLTEIVTDYTGEIVVALLENTQNCSGSLLFSSPRLDALNFEHQPNLTPPNPYPPRDKTLGTFRLGTRVNFGIFVNEPCAPASYPLTDTTHVFTTRSDTTWYILVYFQGVNFFAPPDLAITVQTLPLFHPVIFIHGLGGQPTNWTTPPRSVYLNLLKEVGYDDQLIRTYSYADADGNPETYDYQGDISKIAADLPALVDELSALHQTRGGDGQVDIVGYSLGGLIARYYANTHANSHNLRQLITIATPHQGVFWFSAEKQAEKIAPGWTQGALHDSFTQLYQDLFDAFINQNNAQPISYASPAVQQTVPQSPFLQNLNAPANLPPALPYKALYGEMDVGLRIRLFGHEIIKPLINFGDGIVLTESATGIPTNTLETSGVSDQGTLLVKLAKDEQGEYKYAIAIDNPTYEDLLSYHRFLIVHPMIWAKTIEFLSSS